jgi:biopolymer transport protein ExbD
MAVKLPDDGGGDEPDDGAGLFAEINITPLTDVFLVMMVIFMLSALAIRAEADQDKEKAKAVSEKVESEKRSGLNVSLPTGAAQEIDTTKASLVMVIPVDGDVAVDGKIVRDEDIDNLFRAAFTRDKTTQVVLQADKGVAHGRVVNIMERAKGAGLTKLAIGTAGGS